MVPSAPEARHSTPRDDADRVPFIPDEDPPLTPAELDQLAVLLGLAPVAAVAA